MLYTEFFKKYDSKDKSIQPADYDSRVGASLAVQIHTSGTRPKYTLNGYGEQPESYDPRFDNLFKTRLLNRHPNESDDLYNWRLSVYSPISKEISDRFMNHAKGCILQPNNYVISGDDNTQEYIDSIDLRSLLNTGIEYLFNNPKGLIAVIVEDYDGQQTTKIKPTIKFIYPGDILMQDSESVAFICGNYIYYLDKLQQVRRLISGTDFQIIPHNFAALPFKNIENEFGTPFVNWADLLVRNMNDDEMMTKQYSYPIKQVVLPECSDCNGKGKISVQDDINNPSSSWHFDRCESCNGSGTMSVNPGQHYTFTEEKLVRNNNVMPDLAKFITPDVSIPQYHMGRWQIFYEKCEQSLFLKKKINATESGDAKKEDRKDQYAFLQSYSRFLFDNIKFALEFVSAYVNYNNAKQVYEKQSIVVIAPKQLDLMTDSDIVSELIDIQGKTDDSMVLGEVAYSVMHKVMRDDALMGKINDVLYEYDNLYGVSGMALKSKYLSGVYTNTDKQVHEKGYKILLQISRELSTEVFIEKKNKELASDMFSRIAATAPQGVYE